MRAVWAGRPDPGAPLAGLVVGDLPEPTPPPGWVLVTVRAAALNHHDLWTLRGHGLPASAYPMVLGCEAAGIAEDGTEVLLHPVVGDPAVLDDVTLDPERSVLSERHPGTFAERVAVPPELLVAKPPEISFADAACLGGSWLTAYRMLFVRAGLLPGDTVLVQGAAGGVATAAVALARAAGLRVWATGRDSSRRRVALQVGAHEVFEAGARLPARVDAVVETTGAATWHHSLRALRPGGTVVVCGSTTGADPPADLTRLFVRQLRVVGCTLGTRRELTRLVEMVRVTGIRPLLDSVLPLEDAEKAFARVLHGEVTGKIVLTP
jgi:NADPH:quinone reductase-like Zn-dependent oxidoreductase